MEEWLLSRLCLRVLPLVDICVAAGWSSMHTYRVLWSGCGDGTWLEQDTVLGLPDKPPKIVEGVMLYCSYSVSDAAWSEPMKGNISVTSVTLVP